MAARGLVARVRPSRRVAFPINRYFHNPEKRLVYCPIPKNANTSLKLWFLQTLGIDASGMQSGEVHRYDSDRHTLAGCTHREAQRVLDRSLTFVVIRDPWRRAVSGYVDKFVKQPPSNRLSRRVVARHRAGQGLEVGDDEQERGLSFREFVAHLCETPDEQLNPHWMPQHRFLAGRRFDVEIRFEELDDGMADLSRRLGVEAPVPRTNITPYVTDGAAGDLADVPSGELRQIPGLPEIGRLLTPDLHARLGERYRRDVERFGYGTDRAI